MVQAKTREGKVKMVKMLMLVLMSVRMMLAVKIEMRHDDIIRPG
jgi:hypothetical protein